MNKSILSVVVSATFMAMSQTGLAGEVTGLTSFTANTPAVAAQVNANFTAVKTAVDNNHARVTTIEGFNAAARLTALESNAANSSFTGNITLVPSTATAGNIMKGANRFLHDYGTNNAFLGLNAGNFTMTGSNNTASGAYTLQGNTTGYYNTASGTSALQFNTTGYSNTASGTLALYSNTTGTYNTASGANSLGYNTTGYNNTANGVRALQFNTTGYNNTANGLNALLYNTTGGGNTASGVGALSSNSTGINNTASGVGALSNNTIGNSNTAVGVGAGINLTTGSNNIAIDNAGVVAESNTTRIGDNQTRAFIAGIRGVTTATAAIPVLIGTDGQLGTTSSSRRVKDDIADMGETSNILKQLRPVTFHYKADQNPKGRSLQYGLVAEEVEKVAPGLVARSANGEIETVFYQHLTPMLLNEYQKQQRTIEAQAAMLKYQNAELAKQTARVAQLEQQAQELAGLKAQMAHVTAVLSRLQLPEQIAAAK